MPSNWAGAGLVTTTAMKYRLTLCFGPELSLRSPSQAGHCQHTPVFERVVRLPNKVTSLQFQTVQKFNQGRLFRDGDAELNNSIPERPQQPRPLIGILHNLEGEGGWQARNTKKLRKFLHITLDSPAAFRAAACSARHTGVRRAPQLRTIVPDAELKNNGSAKESGRGPGPRTTSWKETSEEKAMMHRARTRDCGGRRDSRNETSRIVVRMEVATMSGLVTGGIRSKPICIHEETERTFKEMADQLRSEVWAVWNGFMNLRRQDHGRRCRRILHELLGKRKLLCHFNGIERTSCPSQYIGDKVVHLAGDDTEHDEPAKSQPSTKLWVNSAPTLQISHAGGFGRLFWRTRGVDIEVEGEEEIAHSSDVLFNPRWTRKSKVEANCRSLAILGANLFSYALSNAERALAAGRFANVPTQWDWGCQRCTESDLCKDSELLNSLSGCVKFAGFDNPSAAWVSGIRTPAARTRVLM
ncbi:hypothetical protein DFH08DRAFT_827659 [Mycena albidolilacea]|uniref:Uncharacterized protein n=1 Tax=Mycena albidolilacea TaxID=1033008 RepID=A0AAD6YYK7_9AGAR|nr:hypothetical protein DFH08DRAFT_827659 [Mycena albidolilacea]